MGDEAGDRGPGGARGARARLGRRAARRGRPRARSTPCATRPPTSWPRPCSTSSPGAKLGIGPAIDDGFYYDFDLPRSLTPEDLAAVEERMAASVAAAHPFVRTELAFDDARAAAVAAGPGLQGRDPRRPGRRGRAAAGEPLPATSFYEHGPFSDLCKGPHVATTAAIGPFKLLSVAGAYWRGDEKRPMLQRIYGTVWETQEELDQFLWRREEAKKRDHRRLGVAPRPLQLPRRQPRAPPSGTPRAGASGGRSRRRCASSRSGAATRRSARRSLVHEKLWQQSGHWAALRGQHVPPRGRGADVLAQADELPREHVHLPQPRALLSRPAAALHRVRRLHRNERSGALSGLTRVRQFIQDDAHIFVRPDQLADEIEALLGEVKEAYGWFGFEPRFTFATRPDKALGDPALWERAEGLIREALERSGVPYASSRRTAPSTRRRSTSTSTTPSAASGRWPRSRSTWSMLPERFDLSYIDEHGPAAAPDRDPPGDLRLARAVHRHPGGALRRGVPALAARPSRPW